MVLSDKVQSWLKIFFYAIASIIIIVALYLSANKQQEEVLKLKDYKDGIQNHLVWDIKGACYFVRPHTDVTTYLIRVNDCDKK